MPYKIHRLLLAAILVGILTPSITHAQRTFELPSQSPNWSRYQHPELCYAAGERAGARVRWGTRQDTMPYDPQKALPSEQVAIARVCMGRFSVATVDTVSLYDFMRVALIANADSLIPAVIQREFAIARAVHHLLNARKDTSERSMRRGIYKSFYIPALWEFLDGARPIRLSIAQEFVAQIDSMCPTCIYERWQAHHALLADAWHQLDLDRLVSQVNMLDTIIRTPCPDSVPPSFTQIDVPYVRTGLLPSMRYLVTLLRAGADSALRQLPPGGLPSWASMFGLSSLGRQMPPISGAYWFGRSDTAAIQPKEVSIVTVLDAQCGDGCYPMYAALRRLRRQFPNVPMIFVTSTRGYLRRLPPLEPKPEAERLHDYFQSIIGFPIVLGVETTSYVTLPDPDRRRVLGSFRAARGFDDGLNRMYITDAQGRIVYAWSGEVDWERALTAVLRKLTATDGS